MVIDLGSWRSRRPVYLGDFGDMPCEYLFQELIWCGRRQHPLVARFAMPKIASEIAKCPGRDFAKTPSQLPFDYCWVRWARCVCPVPPTTRILCKSKPKVSLIVRDASFTGGAFHGWGLRSFLISPPTPPPSGILARSSRHEKPDLFFL